MTYRRPTARRALFENLEGRTLLTITPAHVALARRSVAETTVDNNLYTNGNYTVNWAGINGKTTTVTQADCTTYVTALLRQAYGTDFYSKFGSTSPSLTTYYNEAVADDAVHGFKQIAEVKPGDFFVCRYLDPDPPARGHMVMIDGAPVEVGTTRPGVRAFNVTIIDVTGSPHTLDTRNKANADGTNDTGVGRGNVRFYTDLDGNIKYWAWGTNATSTTYDTELRPTIFFKVPAMTINAPTTLVAAANGETSVSLSWTDRSGIEDGYAVERSRDDGATWTYVGDVNKNVTTYTDTSATPGTWQYRVYAVGGSSQSAAASTTVSIAPVVPATPSDFTAVLSGSSVSLSWIDRSTTEIGYVLERATSDGAFTPLTTLPANASGYTDATAAAGYLYTYRLTAATSYAQSGGVETSLSIIGKRAPVVRTPAAPAATRAVVTARSTPVVITGTKTTAKIVAAVAQSPVRRSVTADVLGF